MRFIRESYKYTSSAWEKVTFEREAEVSQFVCLAKELQTWASCSKNKILETLVKTYSVYFTWSHPLIFTTKYSATLRIYTICLSPLTRKMLIKSLGSSTLTPTTGIFPLCLNLFL